MRYSQWCPCGKSLTSFFAIALLAVAIGCSDPVTPPGGEDTSVGDEDTADTGGINADVKSTDTGTGDKDTGPAADCTKAADCSKKDLGIDGQACMEAACVSGSCKAQPIKDGGACDDGWECTAEGTCKNGKCQKGTKGTGAACKGKAPPGKVAECVEPACKTDGSCAWTNISSTAAKDCDDDNKCTKNDTCKLGGCFGDIITAKDCDDKNECTDDLCKKADGCVNINKADKTICNDGNKCTDKTECTKGVCGGGVKVTCDDKNPCTTDSCDKADGCKFKVRQDGVTCDDGSKCTDKDECKAGICKGQLKDDAKAPNPCVKAKCNATSGKTTFTPVADGGVCSDGDACTIDDECQSGGCKGKALKCNDSNDCTFDECDKKKGSCVSVPLADGVTNCTDSNKCTSNDRCTGGVCNGDAYTKTGDCDDKNPCTNDACSPQTGCFYTPKAGLCSDNNPCTVNDKCDLGVCKGVAKNCNDGDPCTNDACLKDQAGKCGHTKFEGPCNDNNKCTTNDICNKAAKCVGKDIDCNDNNTCTIDVCASDKGCTYINVKGGTKCEDGLACTTQEVCDSGKCLVVKDNCTKCAQQSDCTKLDDGDPCNGVIKCVTAGTKKVCDVDKKTIPDCAKLGDGICSIGSCNPKTGACLKKLKPDGAPCKDGSKCTEKTTCDKVGACIGPKINCDDKESCTVDSCDPKQGCLHAKKKDKETCDDNNKCTTGDTCDKGVCIYAKNTCTCLKDDDCKKYDDGDLCNGVFACTGNLCLPKKNSEVKCKKSDVPCIENICQKVNGQCAPIKLPTGQACDDNNKCTLKDKCSNGKCDGEDALKAGLCDDNNVCTDDICDKIFGCNKAKKGIGAACDDGNACTTKTKCDKDDQCSGQKVDCDDGNGCTLDTCKAGSGCLNQVDNTLKCDDGNPCTVKDRCDQGICKSDDVTCNDKNPCTIDVCAGKAGCKNVVQGGKDCDDGQPCTITDRCDLAGKCAGKKKNCDDGASCTEDSCVNGACIAKAKVGLPCDDGSKCTEKDACDKDGVCKSQIVDCNSKIKTKCRKVVGQCSPTNGCTIADNDGVSCSDGNLCTFNDKCSGGSCQGLPLKCDDNNPCTVDSCDPKAGCRNKLNTCDDGNDCTHDKCDPPKSAAAPNGTGKGCVNNALDGFQPCDDGNPCTQKGKCAGKKCSVKAVICNDKNTCTLDSCNAKWKADPKDSNAPKSACVFLPVQSTTTVCDDGDKCTSDRCDGLGKCVGTKIDCSDGNDCTKDLCTKDKGCNHTTDEPNGTKCDDGNICTAKTKCHGGLCSGGNKICFQCQVQKDCDQYDNNNKCDGWLECVVPKGTKFGTCQPRNDPKFKQDPIVCDTLGDAACEKNLCQPLTGKCKMTQLTNGTICQDGDACTVNDKCSNGKCSPGIPADCSTVANACNTAVCRASVDTKTGYECVPIPRPATPLCDADGSGCTANDYCKEGKCIAGKKVDCSGTAGECEIAACKSTGEKTFQCAKTPAKDGASCDDKQFCTAGDTCKSGKCTGGVKAPDCSKFDGACSSGICDPKENGGFGACQPKIKPGSDKKPCDADGNGCTVNDICANGVCVAGAPPNCAKLNGACTVGACKSTGALQFECVAAPTREAKPCEADKNGCTIGDRCVKGKCTAGTPADCKAKGDGKCLVGTCKSLSNAQYTCIGSPAKTGSPCDSDGNGCTRNDACNDKGACQPGPTVNCNKDSGTCAIGTCVSVGTDKFECKGAAKPDNTPCDADGNGCTEKDKCQGGKCVAGKAPDCSAHTKGACVLGGCTNKGSDKYLCEPYPRKNGQTCNADNDGCTKNDACEGGTCTKGAIETCKSVAGPCVNEKCQSKGSNDFKCLVAAKESYKTLDPPTACTPTTGKAQDTCLKGYLCGQTGTVEVVDPKDKTKKIKIKKGLCQPSVQVTCDDGSQCTQSDVCHGGSCTGQSSKDCDDRDPCTLDACVAKDGTCSHKKIAGCVKCIDDDFEPDDKAGLPTFKDWAPSSKHPKHVSFKLDKAGAIDNSQLGVIAQWKGQLKYKDHTGKLVTEEKPIPVRLLHRRYYLRKGTIPPVFQFKLLTKFTDQGCAREVVQVVINNEVQWQQCKTTPSTEIKGSDTSQFIQLPLAKWAGDTVDIEFRVWADGKDTTSGGWVKIDDVMLAGNCGPGCLAAGFETVGLNPPYEPDPKLPNAKPPELPPFIPANVQPTASAANYFSWKLVTKGTHTGRGAVQAKYSGAPPGGKAQTASLRMPIIRPVAKDTLYFAMKLEDTGAAGDELSVIAHQWDKTESSIVGSTSIFKRTVTKPGWSVVKIDLSAYAGKSIDLEWRAKTATAKGAKGTFMLDSIAIQGLCQYACFRESWDLYGIKKWQVLTKDKKKSAKLSTTQAKTKPNSLYVTHGSGINDKVPLIVGSKPGSNLMIQGSVSGMSWEYDANIFMNKKLCPAPGVPATGNIDTVNIKGQYQDYIDSFETAQLGPNDPRWFSIHGQCESSSGWKRFKGKVPDEGLGRVFIPQIWVTSPKVVTDLKGYIDNITIICK